MEDSINTVSVVTCRQFLPESTFMNEIIESFADQVLPFILRSEMIHNEYVAELFVVEFLQQT